MKWRSPSPNLGLLDPHELQGVCIDDFEVVASIHEPIGEASAADDGVDNERYLLGFRM